MATQPRPTVPQLPQAPPTIRPIIPEVPRPIIPIPIIPRPVILPVAPVTTPRVPTVRPIVPVVPTPIVMVPRPTVIAPAITRPTVTVPRPTIIPQPITTIVTPPAPRVTVPPAPRVSVPPAPKVIVPRTAIAAPVVPRTAIAATAVPRTAVAKPRIPSPVKTIQPTITIIPPINVGSPEKPASPLTITAPIREVAIPTLPAEIPNIDSPVEIFVQEIIAEQNADIMDEKEYLGYVRYLLNDQSKYDIFARLFPENTCQNVTFRVNTVEIKKDTAATYVPRIIPNEQMLFDCIKAKEQTHKSVAVYLSYENHANLLWFDTENKLINRYDPQAATQGYKQDELDDAIREYLGKAFPDYYYLGNTLETWQCVQGIREQGRTYKADYYCQDYSLLYAINRINGMSHEEAAFALVARGEDILFDLAELLRALAYKIRAELGKTVPEQYRVWRPTMRLV